MEEEILEEMIRDRETQIKMIQTKLELQARRMKRIQEELATTREQYSKEHVYHTMTLEQCHQHYSKTLKQIKEALQTLDMTKQQQGPQVHVYNEAMKAVAAPENRDSSYVIRMQGQLCKAMHNMGMLETQLAMITAHAGDRQKYLKESITFTVEEKSRVELLLMNDLIMADNARREVETKRKNMLESFTTEKDALIEKLEKQQEEAEKDEEEKEEDNDEEKAELQEILMQGREEIARLQAENKEEFARLEELKTKVAAVRGENFVEELMASLAEEFKEKEGGDDDEDDEEEEEEEDED